MNVAVAPLVPGLSSEHQALLTQLVGTIVAKQAGNQLRRSYYDAEAGLKDLGISIPPQMRSVETVVGWPAKAVDSMARRTVLDGFTSPSGDVGSLGVSQVWDENRLSSESSQAHTSALIHSTAFVAVVRGDVAAGDPEAVVSTFSAESASGVWDRRRRCLSSALTIRSCDSVGVPDDMVLYVPNQAIIMKRSGAVWDVRTANHVLGVPVEPLTYRASLDRPFGSARISKPVMALTDSAVRTLLRTEVSAEFYSAPQRYVLGADEGAFFDADGAPIPAWQAVLGRLFAIGRDEDGNTPTVGQFSQQSMEPHLAQIRSLASMFAAETSLPVGSLGVVQDNPSSAEAIYAAKEELVVEIQHWETTSLGPAWQRAMVNALLILDGSDAARDAYSGLRARWASPATPSVVSAADAMVKQVAAIPELAKTDVALERLGYTADEIVRLRSEWRRNEGASTIDALIGA